MELNSVTNIDRQSSDRVVPMRCLVMGLGRTGTHSMCEALRLLGFDQTYHMENAVGNIKDNQLWVKALAAKYEGGEPFGKTDWDRLLGHCQVVIQGLEKPPLLRGGICTDYVKAVTDFPAVLFAPELIAAYPEAKVVLTERDIKKWHRSVTLTIDRYYRDWFLWILTYVDHVTAAYGLMFYKTWFYFSKGDFATHGRQSYIRHYQEVRELVSTENLLVYNVSEGWEPLCAFLRLPVPDSPFPTGNDQDSFWHATRAWNRSRAMAAVKKASTWALCAAVLFVALQTSRA